MTHNVSNKHFEPVLVCCGSLMKTHKLLGSSLGSCKEAVRYLLGSCQVSVR